MNGTALADRRGQTLIEAIAALGILVIGFLGILALLARSFATVRTVADETTGTYLAAEGVELTKSILDHVMYGNSVPPGLGAQDQWPCFVSGGSSYMTPGQSMDYGFDYTVLESGGNCYSLNGQQKQGQSLNFDPATGLYGYGAAAGSIATGFKRTINISIPSSNPYEVVVISTVTWNNGASQAQLEDHFYEWLP